MNYSAFKLKAYFLLMLSGLTLSFDLGMVQAQIQSANKDTLAEIKITASKFNVENIYQPVQILQIDPKTLRLTGARDLSTLLSVIGHAHVRSYGPGLAAGLTQRGFTTSSFQIIRDGFVLNNPLYGQVDMALIPTDLISTAEGAVANASSAYGSSSLGGSLVLGNHWNTGISIDQTVGSFGYNQTSISAGEQWGSTRLKLQIGRSEASNRYSFLNTNNQTIERRTNNSQSKQWLRIGSLGTWRQFIVQSNLSALHADREIPDPIIYDPAEAHQADSEFRFTTILTPNDSNKWSIAAEATHHDIDYSDKYLSEPSQNRIQSLSLNSKIHILRKSPFRARMDNGLSVTHARSNNFDEIKSRSTVYSSLTSEYHALEKLIIYPSIRYDWISDVDHALSYSTGLNIPVYPKVFHLRSQFSKNFTVPTLNDLYWMYGGNPNLLPETSTKADIGYHFDLKRDSYNMDVQFQAYWAKLDDGIIWRPVDLNNWSPINVQQIRSRGFEQSLNLQFSKGSFNSEIRSQITYTDAIISKSRYSGDQAVGKQLPYTPKWMLRLQPMLSVKNTELALEISHDGKRFINTDQNSENDILNKNRLINLTIAQHIKTGKIKSLLKFNINNIENKKYYAVNNYPLPGRSFNFSINLSI